ncbi:MAG: TAT-variant-translocated molybdopterin oxidoreductase [Schleiferiaceae bacterium]|nr:TAT-variant-translocated molybdopterin oxidoreductase [Schleiferiaceae bacterium]
MAENKKFWTSFEQLGNTPLAQKMANKEFAEEIPTDEFLGDAEKLESTSTSRRDFLKFLGFSTAAATVAACESPVVESIPYVVKPEEVIPGMPNYYATTYFDGSDYASVLVKTREGRPIKIEPNKKAHFNGGTNARIQGSVMSLYDSNRLQDPMLNGEKTDWKTAIDNLKKELDKAENSGKDIALLTSTVISPSTKSIINKLHAKYTRFKHIQYDAFSVSHKLDYYEKATGVRGIPHYRLDKAKVVVSFGADFLNGWTGQDIESDYAAARTPGKDMARHIQIETNMSLTGSNADKRIKVKPSEMGTALTYLFNQVAHARYTLPHAELRADLKSSMDALAAELNESHNKGNSVIMVGGNDAHLENIAFAMNFALGNVSNTVALGDTVFMRQGNDTDVNNLLAEMKAGKVGVLMMDGVNPSYTMGQKMDFDAALSKVPFSVSMTEKLDETASQCTMALAKNNFLESWGDALPKVGIYALSQPVIRPLFNTKQTQEVLLAIAGEDTNYYKFLRAYYDRKTAEVGIDHEWNHILHDGTLEIPLTAEDLWEKEVEMVNSHATEEFVYDLMNSAHDLKNEAKGGKFELSIYQKAGIGTGVMANNPHLQELPDPISRVSWDNYLTMSAADALAMELINEPQSNGAVNGSYVKVTVDGVALENVPVLIQPGQTQGTVGLAAGYGRKGSGKAGDGVGVNAYTLMSDFSRTYQDITIEKMDGEHEFAMSQLGHTMMGRKIVNTATLDEYLNEDSEKWNTTPMFHTHKGHLESNEVSLWEEHDHETGHMWNMSMDLNSCTGCGACVVACHIENNVPVVGKEEIRRHRDMHWLRIDRYYTSDMTDEVAEESGIGAIEKFAAMETASSSPEVYFQPVMCQHCNHAPCETVCPVAATSHSAEGLNHMAYNRCIGTRYCANNCPYKVRRFNWFNYNGNSDFADVNPAQDDYGRMVLNPDVVVRSRGVMEKCSLCVQRIQYGKLEAKKEGRAVKDGEIQTACAEACSTGSFVFGDVNDKDSAVLKAKKDKRAYHLLEEVGTQPSVFYQTKIRNKA